MGRRKEATSMEVLFLLLLIGLNGVFAMSEIAVVSSRRVRLEQAAQRGVRGAAAALALFDSPSRFLSAVQVGITCIGIVAGAFGEATLSLRLELLLLGSPTLAPYASVIATAIVVIAITYLSVVLGELVPKRLAMNSPERIAAAVAGPMNVLSRAAAPFVNLLSGSTDLIVRLLGMKVQEKEEVTEEDIRSLIEHGTEKGVFLEKERELVDRIFRLGDQRVSALMVPRTEVVWIEADAPPERVRLAVAAYSHSHFPVCQKGLDNVLGVVHLKDMVKAGILTNQTIDLKVLARKPLFVPESMPAIQLLEEFRAGETHIAFVLDEYGVLAGLITLNDIVERLIGHVSRGGEDTEPLAVQRADGSWLLDGALPVQDLKALMQVERLPHQDRTSFNTLAGFVMTHLGRVPHAGDVFTWERFRFEVVDMDRHRIDKVMLSFTRPKHGETLLSEPAE
jgi:putative hemolysin